MAGDDDEDGKPGTGWVYNPCGCGHKSHGDDGCNQNLAPNAPLGGKCSQCISWGH